MDYDFSVTGAPYATPITLSLKKDKSGSREVGPVELQLLVPSDPKDK